MESSEEVTSGTRWLIVPGLLSRAAIFKAFRADSKMRFGVHTHGPLASGSAITTPNEIREDADLEMGFTPDEIQPQQVPSNSGIWQNLSDRLSWWATDVKRVKPHQPRRSENAEPGIWQNLSDRLSWWATDVKRVKPHQRRPSENAEPGPEPEPRHGEVKEAKGLSRVKLVTQMVLPAAAGWGGYFVIGQGALFNRAFAFSVFGLHVLGIMSMVVGWYMEAKSPRVSGRMQTLGQLLCIACLILSQTPVSDKLK